MRHFASPRFWEAYEGLPETVRKPADKNFALLRLNPQHPSLNFKRVGRYWSARVGRHYRALAVEADRDLTGTHAEYDVLIRRSVGP
jgi:hypothetical protein